MNNNKPEKTDHKEWPGKYIPKDHQNPQSHQGCKALYLYWVERLYPDVLEELIKEMSSSVKDAIASMIKNEVALISEEEGNWIPQIILEDMNSSEIINLVNWIDWYELGFFPEHVVEEFMAPESRLLTWANKYNLTDKWILECAIETLWLLSDAICLNLRPKRRLKWHSPVVCWNPQAVEFHIKHRETKQNVIRIDLKYNPTNQDKKKVREEVNKSLTKQLDAIEEKYKESKAFTGRSPHKLRIRDFKWLAMYQVGRMRKVDIHNQEFEVKPKWKYIESADRKNIDRGIIRAAKLAGVTLRTH